MQSQITAKVVQDSISPDGVRICTIEAEYPRFIHSELMTHRVFSRNAASSRAIPIDTMMKQVTENPASPVLWGTNQPGMQAGGEVLSVCSAEAAWQSAAQSAVRAARQLQMEGLHKQIVNRVLEPFQRMKTVITSTEWDNFFSLRLHKDAQPEIQVLAREIYVAMANSEWLELGDSEWHVPYVSRYRCPEYGHLSYFIDDEEQTDLSIDDARKVSASCCAQVSYRKNDDSLEKAILVYDRLVNSKPIHASPFEHQATPSNPSKFSGNLRGYTQFRKLIEV